MESELLFIEYQYVHSIVRYRQTTGAVLCTPYERYGVCDNHIKFYKISNAMKKKKKVQIDDDEHKDLMIMKVDVTLPRILMFSAGSSSHFFLSYFMRLLCLQF